MRRNRWTIEAFMNRTPNRGLFTYLSPARGLALRGRREALFFFISWLSLLALVTGCTKEPETLSQALHRTPRSSPAIVRILATTDVHGWLAPQPRPSEKRLEGGLGLAATRFLADGYDPMRPASRAEWLLLDVGDMWTGPPESTLLRGRPMLEAYKALGYDAAAIGNHEFDFGIDTLRGNALALPFPLLSANIHQEKGGPDLDFLRPSQIVTCSGLQVGIIGLTFVGTPETTFPPNVRGLRFEPYVEALRREAARLRNQTDFLIVLLHDGQEVLREVALQTADLPVRVFLGGHSHEPALEVLTRNPDTPADDVILLTGRNAAKVYGRILLTFDQGALASHTETLVPVTAPLETEPPRLDPQVAAIVQRAHEEVGPVLGEVVGTAKERLEVGTPEFSPLGELLTRSWLTALPGADFALTNLGGIRQPLSSGPVTLGDLLSTLPFTNRLLMVSLTPSEIREILRKPIFLMGGVQYEYRLEEGKRTVNALRKQDGLPLEEGRRYKVITTDFLYAGGDGAALAQMDPLPEWLGIDWRDPLIALLRDQGATGTWPPARSSGILLGRR